MLVQTFLTLLLIMQTADETPPQAAAESRDCVILLHGLARTAGSMRKMEQELTEAGYYVVNQPYESREKPIEELAPTAVEMAIKRCREFPDGRKLHFVTHSLGGILVRFYFSENTHEALSRVVMLGPPNQGSQAAETMGNVPGFDWLNGPAGRQLGKGEDSVPLALGPPDFEFAVIAGDRTIDPITSAVLKNPDDGKVTVEETKLEGMSDFTVVHVSHAYLMKDEQVIELVKSFLRDGTFDLEEETP